MIANFVINCLWFLTPHSRVEVRAGSQIATMPLHHLLFILRLSSCWLLLPMRYISGTGVVGSLLQWWKRPVKWSGSGELLLLGEENTCMWKMVRFGKCVWGSSGILHPLHSGSGEKYCLQLLDSAGRKPVLWAERKAIESNRSAWLFIFVIGHVSIKCPESTSCWFVSLVIKLVSHKDEKTQQLP